MNSLIISGGHVDLPFADYWMRREHWDLLIAADRGTQFCREADVLPDAVIGDFDSAQSLDLRHFKEICPERFRSYPAAKDESDTELALDYALAAGADKVTVLGGTGTRLDHLLGNIELLKKALDAGAECFLIDPCNRIRMVNRGLTLKRAEQFGDYVSLIPFTSEVTGLTLTGFLYGTRGLTLTSGNSRGISNRISDAEGRIEFEDGILIVVESMD